MHTQGTNLDELIKMSSKVDECSSVSFEAYNC